MYRQGYDRQEDCVKDPQHHVYIIVWNQTRHLDHRSRDATQFLSAFFISNESTVFTEDRILPAPFGFYGDPLPEAYSLMLETVSSRDFRRPRATASWIRAGSLHPPSTSSTAVSSPMEKTKRARATGAGLMLLREVLRPGSTSAVVLPIRDSALRIQATLV